MGWMVDGKGQITSDPSHVTSDGILMPLGGTELHSGYKGTGLGMMVEILCGILSGKCKIYQNWVEDEGMKPLSHICVYVCLL